MQHIRVFADKVAHLRRRRQVEVDVAARAQLLVVLRDRAEEAGVDAPHQQREVARVHCGCLGRPTLCAAEVHDAVLKPVASCRAIDGRQQVTICRRDGRRRSGGPVASFEPVDEAIGKRRMPILPLHLELLRALPDRAALGNLARQPVDDRLVEDVKLAVAHREEQRCRLEHARLCLGVPLEQRGGHHLGDRLTRRRDEFNQRPRHRPRGAGLAFWEGAPEVDRVHLAQPGGQRVERRKVDGAPVLRLALEVLREQVRVQEEALRLC
mmetsp:Transcript_27008/g.72503  ORF Transcript_27008/g.72503 Transcript_27008/m.72503 type:complete len:267 (+) Transcript_27008:514-1314(+)